VVSGTSTIAWHLGQRAFLPAYLASTLNLAEQPVHRQRISMTNSPRQCQRVETKLGRSISHYPPLRLPPQELRMG
jgi:hypothetical protein